MSELANLSRKRNWLKFKLLGCTSIFCDNSMSPYEKIHAAFIKEEIRIFLNNFNNNSRKLGIKPKE